MTFYNDVLHWSFLSEILILQPSLHWKTDFLELFQSKSDFRIKFYIRKLNFWEFGSINLILVYSEVFAMEN